MKLNFKQSVYVGSVGRVVNANEEVEVKDKVVAEDLVNAEYAEVVEKPTSKAKKEKAGDK